MLDIMIPELQRKLRGAFWRSDGKDIRCESESMESLQPSMISMSAIMTPAWHKFYSSSHGSRSSSSSTDIQGCG